MTSLGLGLRLAAARPAAAIDPYSLVPQDGILAEWRFEEESGDSVADSTGNGRNIDLTLPTSPNATWQGKGILLASGLVQAPAITGVKTVVYICRTTKDQTAGFEHAGVSAVNHGAIGATINLNSTWYAGWGNSIHPMFFRASSGGGAWENNRAGWKLVVRVLGSAGNVAIGFGGRVDNTTQRVSDFEIIYAAAYSGTPTLDDLYTAARAIAKKKGHPIDWRDCASYADTVLLWGQSNADGRAIITNLPAPDQARAFTKSFLQLTTFTSVAQALGQLALGTSVNQSATLFGPEFQMAVAREDGADARPLYFSKTAISGTWLDDSGNAAISTGTTWSTDELQTTAGLWNGALKFWYDVQAAMLLAGVGPKLAGLCWMQGEADATDATAAAAYQANLQNLYDAAKTYTGYASLPIVVGRITTGDAGETEAATVRTAQADFVAANSSLATLIDTDSFGIGSQPHFNSAGQISLGQAFYDALFA